MLVTAGNLVFQGTIGTTFAAYRADTGEKVWEMPVQQVPIAAPITYEVDGEQYIAVNAGWGGGLAHVERSAYTAAVPVEAAAAGVQARRHRAAAAAAGRLDGRARAEPAAAR